MTAPGPVVYAFFERHLKAEKGLSPASVKSYRDALRLFLAFVGDQHHRQITRLAIEDLTADKVREFLSHLALQLHFSSTSESMGHHDSGDHGWLAHRLRRHWSCGRHRCVR